MAKVAMELKMHGVTGSIALSDLGQFLDRFQRFTDALARDRDIEAARWQLTKLGTGSAIVGAQLDVPGDIDGLASNIVTGIEELREASRIPNVIPLRALAHAEAMGRIARNHPTTIEFDGRTTTVDNVVYLHARKARQGRRTSLGGFYGRIELLDLRRGRRFGLRDDFTRRWIPCLAADDEVLAVAHEHLGADTRVFVGGDITENAAGQPLRILARTVEPQEWTTESVERFKGAQPPDERTAAEIVRALRDW